LLSHKTVSHSRHSASWLQVQGLHLSRACPVFICRSCQPNYHSLNPFPLRRTEDLLVPFLLFTPGNSILKSFNALPLRRTTWYYHSYHSLLGFLHALFPGFGRSLLVLVIMLSRVSYHVVHVNRDYHRLFSFDSSLDDSCASAFIHVAIVHSIGLPRTSLVW
jgi:hypothetical protein